jgi:hypothetical protein
MSSFYKKIILIKQKAMLLSQRGIGELRELEAHYTKIKDISRKYVEIVRQNIFLVNEDMSSFRHTSTAWTGLLPMKGSFLKTEEMKKLDGKGFKLFEWDGQ